MNNTPRHKFARMLMQGSGLIVVSALAWAGASQAQTATPSTTPEVVDTEVIIVGVRKSERSAIDRKKKAPTNQDSIVADDVGQFPDKNVSESISRIAGVALERNEDGGTGGVSIRGMSSDLVRVEVNGMSTLNNSGGTFFGGGGRDTNLTDLSSDLIKSVDVIKGSTADMTPGGVGGTVRIEQRTALDFKKPYILLNLQYQTEDVTGLKTPRVNLVATKKFFNNRLGFLTNITSERAIYAGDVARNTNAGNGGGFIRAADFDNSPEKTFTMPASWDPAAAAVTTKAGCNALSTSGINSRVNCLNQWNDYIPDLPRYSRWVRDDQRLSAQFRADYKVTDKIVAFVDVNINTRKLRTQDYNYSITGPTALNLTNAVFSDNHYLLSGTISPINTVATSGSTSVTTRNPIAITTQNRDFVQKFKTAYLSTGFDYKGEKWDIKGRAGRSIGSWEMEQNVISYTALYDGPITIAIDPTSGLYNFNFPTSVNLSNPAMYMTPANCTLVVASTNGKGCTGANRDPYSTAPSSVTATTGYSAVFGGTRLDFTPGLSENVQDQAQIDVTRKFKKAGPLDSIKFGYRYDKTDTDNYSGAGIANVIPGVNVPTNVIQDNFRTCDTAYATATNPCVFGTRANTGTAALRNEYTMTNAQYLELISATLQPLPGKAFLGSYGDAGNIMTTWNAINVPLAFDMMRDMFGLTNHNSNCLKECTGSDGKVYKQPAPHTTESNQSAYAMFNFDTELWGVDVTGNAGVRYQKRNIDAVSFLFLNTSTITNTTPPYTFLNTPVGMVQRTISREVEHVLPSFNIAVWPIEDKLVLRYGSAKVWAPPPINTIVAAGVTCNELADAFDNFLDANGNDVDSSCTGRLGNPELKGYMSKNENISIEWYPNKDTQLSYGIFRNKVSNGYPQAITLQNVELFGKKYDIPTYTNGLPQTVTGWEISGRTAFSYLPWLLKHTGAGFNYSTSITNVNSEIDPITGKMLPLINQSEYAANFNLWYDDGRINARVAYQMRDEYLTGFGRTGYRNLTSPYGLSGTVTSQFNPGSPIFRAPSAYLDARISYKVNKNLEFFLEGKNLTKEVVLRNAGDFMAFDKTGMVPYVHDVSSSGSRYFFGLRMKFE